ncbi:MAG: efflux RND transporter permease subunit [Rhodospirillales bacterium]|nr:efflux RND transporter permease subunit [Rhodospirillales bacterium]
MDLIRAAIDRPIAVLAAVLMCVLFGLVALQVIPIQLTPDVNRPVITIRTSWPGAAPAEVEREIVNRQEDVLRALPGLEEIRSTSRDGRAYVTLEFRIDQDMDKALLLVANRLDRVSGYPEEANEPTLDTAGSEDNPIARLSLTRLPGNEKPMGAYGDFVEDVIQDRIERVPGVSEVRVWGGNAREMVVTVDPERMARYGLTVPRVIASLRAASASVSAGDVEEGKRRYVVRTEGEFTSPEQIKAVLLRSIEDPVTGQVARVTVDDIAEVEFGFKERAATMRHKGREGISISAVRETGTNVIEIMAGIHEAVDELNAKSLPDAGLKLEQVYDETIYIDSAIKLVQQNIWVGGSLAALILIMFLRSGAATLIVSIAIPVSVIGSFVAMAAMGRSINVISLAGLAFAVGMVVDAAIVVLENIYRLRQQGVPPGQAALEGTRQVWGAVMVSALTTVMVFVPILLMKLEVGQLFRDIAVAISVAVLLSLLVAMTVIPALSNRLLAKTVAGKIERRRIPLIDGLAKWFFRMIVAFTRIVAARRSVSLAVVAIVCGAAATTTYLFLPKLEYLPEGNRNFIFGLAVPPPGYNLKTANAIAGEIENEIRHQWASETGPESAPGEPPKIEHFFFIARSSQTFVGASSVDPTRAGDLVPIIQKAVFREPGTFGFVTQPSIFGRGLGSSRSINLNVSGPDLERVLDVALDATDLIGKVLPRKEGNQLRPRPGLELGAPEVRVIPDPVRLADSGVSVRDLGLTVDTFNDGLRVAEITLGGKRVDLTLRGPQRRILRTQGINNLPVVTQSGKILPVGELAKVVVTSGPTEIRHIDRERTVTLQIRPAKGIPLETAMEIVETEVIAKLREAGLPPGVGLRMSGTADKLTVAWNHMRLDLVIAVLIVYLVMAVLFESFVFPLIILLSVPLATAGGTLGLALVNLFVPQRLDMLTLLGFIILVGIVVNNAILLVHQTLFHVRHEGMSIEDAIVAATRNRIRPIFMSTLTSVFGMLPLVLFPGAGSELYRGLGSVVVGGLALSAVLTLAIIPPLLTLVARTIGVRTRRTEDPSAEPSAAE